MQIISMLMLFNQASYSTIGSTSSKSNNCENPRGKLILPSLKDESGVMKHY